MGISSDREAYEHHDVWGPNRDLEPERISSQVRDKLAVGNETDLWASQACDREEKEWRMLLSPCPFFEAEKYHILLPGTALPPEHLVSFLFLSSLLYQYTLPSIQSHPVVADHLELLFL